MRREPVWMGSSLADVRALPDDAKGEIGYALHIAETGGKHPSAKPLQGFGNAGVLEIVADDDGDAYRAVYTVRLPDAVYVLHVFQKKSKQGAATPRRDMEVIRRRLKDALRESARWEAERREGE